MTGGITNKVYKLNTKKGKYILKILSKKEIEKHEFSESIADIAASNNVNALCAIKNKNKYVTSIDDKNVIFFDGETDASGVVEILLLPAPRLFDNLVVPNTATYKITAGDRDSFIVNMYDGICVVQNINYVPGEVYGS